MTEKRKIHPNSLANLDPSKTFNSENAKVAQLASAKARSANSEARKRLKMNMQEWKLYKDDLKDLELGAVDVLRALMMKALDAEDFDTAADLAKSIAEFETPKLGRVENINQEKKADEYTDEELKELIRKHSGTVDNQRESE